MDYMDIDQACDVPDTPDRLAAQNINGRGFTGKDSDSSMSGDEEAKNRLRGRSKLVLVNGHNRRPSFRSGNSLSISNKSEHNGDFTVSSGNESTLKNSHLFRKKADKTANQDNKYSLKSHSSEKGKGPCNLLPPTYRENGAVDLTGQSGHGQILQNALPNGALIKRQAMDTKKGPVLINDFSSSHGMENSSKMAHYACKGKEKIDDTCKGGLDVDRGKGMFGDSQSKAVKSKSSSYSIPSPRFSGQKRLVRNGCISPHNIAKAKQLPENQSNGSMNEKNNKGTLASDSSWSQIKALIAEDDNSRKGQELICHPSSSIKSDPKVIPTRSSVAPNEEATGIIDGGIDEIRCSEGLGGWRSTRSRTKKVNIALSDEGQHLSKTEDDRCFVNQQNENRASRRDNGHGSSNRIANDYHEGQIAASFQHASALSVAQGVSLPLSTSGQVSGRRAAANTLLKRQKQGSSLSNHGESSTSASGDSDIIFIGSSGEPTNSRLTRYQSGRGPGVLDPVIEIDECSPEVRHVGSRHTSSSSNNDSHARARQVEADEMLARELQEQLYNESLGGGDGEIDTNIALALQRGETSLHASSSGRRSVFRPRGSLISNFHRQSQSRSSQNPSARRGSNVRGPASSRLTRLRSSMASQLPRVSDRQRTTLFPADMDMDMRIHILETLEAFSDMAMPGNFFQVERDFNENDYEMLLALDENNHQHGGASLNLINSLPESTVQGDNFEEACAICLDTPSSGDRIRHLPCLHKFHKDCIDPWLRRKTSCPVCKSSIT